MDTRDPRVASLFAAARRIAALEPAGEVDADAVADLARAVYDAAELLPSPQWAGGMDEPVALGPASALDPELFRVSVDQAADAVFWLNAEGGFDYVNGQACALLGYPREELVALKLWDIDAGMTPKKFALHWRSQSAPGAAIRRFETLHRKKDGSLLPVEVSSRHLHVESGTFHVAFARDITARKRADAALRQTQFCIDKAAIAIFRLDRAGRIVSANDEACRNLGYTREELLALRVFDIAPRPEASWDEFFALVRSRGSMTFEGSNRRRDGSVFPVEITVNHIDADGAEYIFSFTRDITAERATELERVSLQAQLVQAQKMESIGRLAGGIAHDFNNMLAIILGYTELLQGELPEGEPAHADIAEIERAAVRARDITRQLLAFSRKQVVTPRRVDLVAVVDNTERTLLRLIGEDIALTVRHDDGPALVEMDPGQIDQILVNLVVNARDATASGGRIAIATSCVDLGEAECRRCVDWQPGRYACLEVADTGHGIAEDVIDHA
ncbi:MAG: PAS domain S-box protein, partial [Deltaproteobacteria bacterium]